MRSDRLADAVIEYWVSRLPKWYDKWVRQEGETRANQRLSQYLYENLLYSEKTNRITHPGELERIREAVEEEIRQRHKAVPRQSVQLDEQLWHKAAWDVPNRENWYDGSFPTMREIVKLSNEALQQRYLDSIRENRLSGSRKGQEYFDGDATLCRIEISSRLKSGFVKFEDGPEAVTNAPSDDELFDRTLPAFTKEIRNLFRDMPNEFQKRLFDVKSERERSAAEEDLKTGFHTVVDGVGIRIQLCKEQAPKVGENFLGAFKGIVAPHCLIISDSSKAILRKSLSDQYTSLIAHQKSSFRQLAASMGREKDSDGMFRSVEHWYTAARSKYSDRLDAEIEKHNLHVSSVGTFKRSSEIELTSSIGEWKSRGEVKQPQEAMGDIGLYIDFVKSTKICRPSYEDLARQTTRSESTWKRRFEDVVWVAELARKLRQKQSQKFSKREETRKMWVEAESFVEDKLTKLSGKVQKRSIPFNDNRRPKSPFDDLSEAYDEEQR